MSARVSKGRTRDNKRDALAQELGGIAIKAAEDLGRQLASRGQEPPSREDCEAEARACGAERLLCQLEGLRGRHDNEWDDNVIQHEIDRHWHRAAKLSAFTDAVQRAVDAQHFEHEGDEMRSAVLHGMAVALRAAADAAIAELTMFRNFAGYLDAMGDVVSMVENHVDHHVHYKLAEYDRRGEVQP